MAGLEHNHAAADNKSNDKFDPRSLAGLLNGDGVHYTNEMMRQDNKRLEQEYGHRGPDGLIHFGGDDFDKPKHDTSPPETTGSEHKANQHLPQLKIFDAHKEYKSN